MNVKSQAYEKLLRGATNHIIADLLQTGGEINSAILNEAARRLRGIKSEEPSGVARLARTIA
jgi:hypothetical protein